MGPLYVFTASPEPSLFSFPVYDSVGLLCVAVKLPSGFNVPVFESPVDGCVIVIVESSVTVMIRSSSKLTGVPHPPVPPE